ncbi:hypothetical protein D7X55_17875 [Corallococcus sp. AB049A]|uniref:Uncharacterized protein n=1 Tax=Corallococcus interemptor TaxID=2316720 RepID=A0A3A8PTQ1_9BACT|nr:MULTISPECIES: hypothetical protein [Corallococcus]RKH41956.1 hypothetical protein D7Y23_32120 [Corallococcus sp. AB050B]RKH59826.1 hypothetical protein D7X96_34700 [Corallococcus interemptor]RKI64518.1 hypothetical protein D7X55_17875 [Corallococcus sp. AB049A]
MTQPVPPPASDEASLQFDRAEFTEAPPATKCTVCQCAIQSVYYEVNQRLLCPACREEVEEAMKGGSKSKRALTASMYGFGAGIAGAIVYWVVSLTGYNIGLIAILVGWMVGTAVFKGSESRGGRGYQALAVLLTYLAVGASLSPDLYKAMKERSDFQTFHAASHSLDSEPVEPPDEVAQAVAAVATTVVLTPALPVLVGIEQPMSGLIYGFALFEAWRRTKRAELNIAGPFKLAEAPAEGEAAPAEQERSVG